MIRTPAARRPAFTLIELLVVISIIALLAAITSGVFARVRAAQTRSATDTTLTKINARLERRVKAVNDQVADDAKNNHPGYAAVLSAVQNVDLAKAIWTHAKMKSELPMSFNEAKAPVVISGGLIATPITIAVIQPKAVFTALPAGGPGGGPDESAVCLFLAVNSNAGGGTIADNDGLEQQVGDSGMSGLKCYKDAWGTPIAFVRTAYNGELSGKPFFNPTPSNPTPFDPFDPRFKLTAFATGNPAWWNAIRAPVTWVVIPGTYPATPNQNHTFTAISAGPNKQWGANAGGDVYGNGPDTDFGKDNHVSYRLRREGTRGD